MLIARTLLPIFWWVRSISRARLINTKEMSWKLSVLTMAGPVAWLTHLPQINNTVVIRRTTCEYWIFRRSFLGKSELRDLICFMPGITSINSSMDGVKERTDTQKRTRRTTIWRRAPIDATLFILLLTGLTPFFSCSGWLGPPPLFTSTASTAAYAFLFANTMPCHCSVLFCYKIRVFDEVITWIGLNQGIIRFTMLRDQKGCCCWYDWGGNCWWFWVWLLGGGSCDVEGISVG